jgi:hypothetical protein
MPEKLRLALLIAMCAQRKVFAVVSLVDFSVI